MARYFSDTLSAQLGVEAIPFNHQDLVGLQSYNWPGNVRELENRVKRAVVLAEGNRITKSDLGFDENDETVQSLNLREAREMVEREIIQRALTIYDNNVTHAADAMGISRPSLYQLVKKLELPEPCKS